jgi:hypothetical protein
MLGLQMNTGDLAFALSAFTAFFFFVVLLDEPCEASR